LCAFFGELDAVLREPLDELLDALAAPAQVTNPAGTQRTCRVEVVAFALVGRSNRIG